MSDDMTGHIAHAKTEISASPDQVWAALTDPDAIEKFMFGSKVSTDWQVGSAITWAGEMEGRAFEDKGEIIQADKPSRLRMTHYSPLTGEPDEPENYHTLDYRVESSGDTTTVTLDQDGNDSEEQAEQFAANWQGMLAGLKAYVEEGR